MEDIYYYTVYVPIVNVSKCFDDDDGDDENDDVFYTIIISLIPS